MTHYQHFIGDYATHPMAIYCKFNETKIFFVENLKHVFTFLELFHLDVQMQLHQARKSLNKRKTKKIQPIQRKMREKLMFQKKWRKQKNWKSNPTKCSIQHTFSHDFQKSQPLSFRPQTISRQQFDVAQQYSNCDHTQKNVHR